MPISTALPDLSTPPDDPATVPALPPAPTAGIPPALAAAASVLPPAPPDSGPTAAPAAAPPPAGSALAGLLSAPQPATGPGDIDPITGMPIQSETSPEDLSNQMAALAQKAGTDPGAPLNTRIVVGTMSSAGPDAAKQALEALQRANNTPVDVKPIPGDPGNFTYTEPSTGNLTTYNPGTWQDVGGAVASVAPTLVGQIGGGLIGTALGSPLGPEGALGGAALGATAGEELARQSIMANNPGIQDPRSIPQRVMGGLTETGLNLAGGYAIPKIIGPAYQAISDIPGVRRFLTATPGLQTAANLAEARTAASPLDTNPQVNATTGLAEPLTGLGLPITGSQVATPGSLASRIVPAGEKTLLASGAGAFRDTQSQAWNDGLASTFGARLPPGTPNLSPAFMADQAANLGQRFENFAQNNNMLLDQQLRDGLTRIYNDAGSSMPAGQAATVRNWIDQYRALSANYPTTRAANGELQTGGQQYLDLTNTGTPSRPASTLARLENNPDPNLANAGADIRDQLNQAMQRAAVANGNTQAAQDLALLRYQYKNFSTVRPLAAASPNFTPSTRALQGAVTRAFGADSPDGGGWLGQFARAGSKFLTDPSSSGTAENQSAIGFLNLLTNPHAWATGLGYAGGGGGLGGAATAGLAGLASIPLGRLFMAAARSPAVRNLAMGSYAPDVTAGVSAPITTGMTVPLSAPLAGQAAPPLAALVQQAPQQQRQAPYVPPYPPAGGGR